MLRQVLRDTLRQYVLQGAQQLLKQFAPVIHVENDRQEIPKP